MQPPRTLTAALLGIALAFGMTVALAQTNMAPTDGQASGSPAKTPGKRTDPPSSTADRTTNTPMAGAETSGASGDMKPHTKKKHRHKKPTDATTGGISHPGGQSGGNDADPSTGNSPPGSSKPVQ
ncbi:MULTISPECIES: hypothetical protein [Ralstonia solanacearum species complex]|uniref:hypothetical protein n=1 Tax=Ralstonia solanacearum species complex TaxID=3116862 RepID=UPI000E598D14|nr:hypothetical protein [Ralstonia solanacearum]BEU75195.1 hypothetical protein MAFF211271_47500 [Ralstonia pseudosolanacearum]AXV79953.1 hypothetical protein CJO76_24230 [Ralstonia solanacearum]AXV93987.1 hypothetical protein CJO79_24215 [Ralstonia solanacearum]AXW22117.1 hypothetical protein CJO85_24345 [Ralstonia solanacearum]AXW78881.1 hypothetical protein CJO97_24220 [Ralstonia solanacearum]